MTKLEKIQTLAEQLHEEGAKDRTQDILIDLKDFLKDAPEEEAPGLAAAIEIIKANYSR